jgi:hypothetical protein
VASAASERGQKAAAATTGEVLPEGRPPKEKLGKLPSSQDDRATENGVSLRTQRKLDTLAREHPDLHAKVACREGHAPISTALSAPLAVGLDSCRRMVSLMSVNRGFSSSSPAIFTTTV